eukprot:gene18016-biopygen11434
MQEPLGRRWAGRAQGGGGGGWGVRFSRILPWHVYFSRFSRVRAAMRTAPGARKVWPDDMDELRELTSPLWRAPPLAMLPLNGGYSTKSVKKAGVYRSKKAGELQEMRSSTGKKAGVTASKKSWRGLTPPWIFWTSYCTLGVSTTASTRCVAVPCVSRSQPSPTAVSRCRSGVVHSPVTTLPMLRAWHCLPNGTTAKRMEQRVRML